MVGYSVDGPANVANGKFVFARNDFAGVIKRPSRSVDRGQLHRELRLRLEERQLERERIARELHDSLLQGLLGVSLQLQVAVGQVPENSPSRTGLEHALLRMQQVIEEARKILLGLRPSVMESMSLDQALSALSNEFPPNNEVRFRVFVTGQRKSLTPAIQEQIYLIGREALINALRHSEGTSIYAEVEYGPQWLRILVHDNGRGIDPETVRSGRHAHWGLAGMRERAAAIGAVLRVWSRVGTGTEVEIWLGGRALAEACI